MSSIPLRHGVFLPPFHPMNENPAACIERDLELMQWLDRLGFHEAWIGEHHSAGWELISSPELFIAVAAERTKWIRFGTGVISLPYHNPLMTANRIIQLDRAMEVVVGEQMPVAAENPVTAQMSMLEQAFGRRQAQR